MKIKALGLIGVAVLAFTWTANATVLLFENTHPYNGGLEAGNGTFYVGFNTFTNYGHRVNSTLTTDPDPSFAGAVVYTNSIGNGWTPNVVASFTHQGGTSSGNAQASGQLMVDSTKFGPLPYTGDQVDYLAFKDGFKFWITLTPDALYGVKVNSFDIVMAQGWSSLTPSFTWTLYQDSTSGAVVATGTESSLGVGEVRPVTTGAGLYYGTEVLEMSYTGTGNNGIVSIDNLNFDQQMLPEPSTVVLMLGGGLALWRTRSKKRGLKTTT